MKHVPTHVVPPEPTPESAEFWSACNDDRLLLRRCDRCAHLFYYPRLACPGCGGRELSWEEVSGRGVVHTHTTVWTSFYGPEWESDIPYVVLLVDLAEGPRVLSRLVGEDEGLRAGAAVRVRFTPLGDQRYPYFALDPEPSR